MRVEPYGIGSVLHITQKGARGMDIVRDAHDKERFMRSLFYLNDIHTDQNWHKKPIEAQHFVRQTHASEREPLVRILAWTLLSNHFHILVQEFREGGTSKFMQRLNGSMSAGFNAKYKEAGSLFQGSYRARVVLSNEHHQYLAFYILVKNVCDMYPGGLAVAANNFDNAWKWAKHYSYSSFRDVISGDNSPIIEDTENLIGGIIGEGDTYKQEAKELLNFHMINKGKDFQNAMLEPW